EEAEEVFASLEHEIGASGRGRLGLRSDRRTRIGSRRSCLTGDGGHASKRRKRGRERQDYGRFARHPAPPGYNPPTYLYVTKTPPVHRNFFTALSHPIGTRFPRFRRSPLPAIAPVCCPLGHGNKRGKLAITTSPSLAGSPPLTRADALEQTIP